MVGFEGCRGGVAGTKFDLTVDSPVVETVDLGACRERDIIEAPPGVFRIGELQLEDFVEDLVHRVVVAVPLRADRGDDHVVSEPLRVTIQLLLDSPIAVILGV